MRNLNGKSHRRASPTRIGYARVSTRRQHLDLQVRALQEAGCEIMICETARGHAAGRRGLAAAIASCGVGDTLVVWKLDRLGRNLIHLVELARALRAQGTRLQVLTGGASSIDITTPEGRALYGIFAAFAEFEYGTSGDRIRAGKLVARQRSRLHQQHVAPVFTLSLRSAFNGISTVGSKRMRV